MKDAQTCSWKDIRREIIRLFQIAQEDKALAICFSLTWWMRSVCVCINTKLSGRCVHSEKVREVGRVSQRGSCDWWLTWRLQLSHWRERERDYTYITGERRTYKQVSISSHFGKYRVLHHWTFSCCICNCIHPFDVVKHRTNLSRTQTTIFLQLIFFLSFSFFSLTARPVLNKIIRSK